MGKFIDLTNQVFGKLTVLERDTERVGREVYWKCQCDCGKIISTRGSSLRKGVSQSCGCKRISAIKEKLVVDLTGQKFGLLTVIEQDINNSHKGAYWLCKCECGNIKSISGSSLREGNTKSCGCVSGIYRSKALTIDLTGQSFGKWKVISQNTDKEYLGKGAYWNCVCECGTQAIVDGKSLRNGESMSCGCINSIGEWRISQLLTKMQINFQKEYSFSDLYGDKNLLRFDFAIFEENNLTCVIEYQGEQHYQNRDFFDKRLSFEKRQEYDNLKRQYCEEHNIKLIEIPYIDLKKIDETYLYNLIYNPKKTEVKI